MKRKKIDDILASAGIPPVPNDHPVYSEPYSISFRSPHADSPFTSIHTVGDQAASIEGESGVGVFTPEQSDEDFEVDVTVTNEDDARCPYCQSAETCEHHLLTVDTTFGEGICGPALEWFYDQPLDDSEDGEDVDETGGRIQAVAAVSDLSVDEEIDLGPCRSSMWRHFYCSTRESKKAAVAALTGLRRGYVEES